jgi:hypothetical protein
MPRVSRFLAGVLLAFATVLVPGVARADTLRADLDGDGVRDRIDVAAPFRELDVRLSGTRALQRLRADDLILRFIIADIDRDGDPDVVAHTRRSGLQIWLNTGRGVFAARPSDAGPLGRTGAASLSAAADRPADDGPCNDQPRQLVDPCSPRGGPLVSSRSAVTPARPRESRFEHSTQIARGPPPSRHRQTSFA